jgi:hypothetical protein
MRCSVLSKDSINEKTGKKKKGTISNIDFSNALVQLKAD